MQLSKSEALFAEAQKYIPGGVNSPVRSFKSVGGTPPFIARGKGSRVWDVDGNEYIDYLGSWGPLVLGHSHPVICAALEQQLGKVWSTGRMATRVAEQAQAMIETFFPATHGVAVLYSTGMEAAEFALRLVRITTRRSEEETLLVECDLRLIEKTRREWPFLRDRRIDAYQDLTKRLRDE